MMLRNKKTIGKVAIALLGVFGFQLLAPGVAMALTAGPTSPDFGTFTPVSTSDMVNISSGDFTYNLPVVQIPGPDGSGYALSLTYNSGANLEDEASWVGFGWSLNPGAISRSIRGVPDEANKMPITRYNKAIPNVSASILARGEIELFSTDVLPADQGTNKSETSSPPNSTNYTSNLKLSASTSLRFNNHTGFARTYGFGVDMKGLVSLNTNISASGTTFSASVNPMKIVQSFSKKKPAKKEPSSEEKENAKAALSKNAQEKAQKEPPKKVTTTFKASPKPSLAGMLAMSSSGFGLYSFANEAKAVAFPELKTNFSFNFSLGITGMPAPIPIGLSAGLIGNLDTKTNKVSRDFHAYGLMNTHKWEGGEDLEKQLLDFQTERQASFDQFGLFLGIPHQNADAFSVTGDGIGGGFRYQPNGTMNFTGTPTTNYGVITNVGVDLDVGSVWGVGISLGFGINQNQLRPWDGALLHDGPSSPKKSAATGQFRLNQDAGGEHAFEAPATKPKASNLEAANLEMISPVPGAMAFDYKLPSAKDLELPNAVPGTTASYKARHIGYAAHDITPSISSSGNITGFTIIKPDGQKYSYEEPVYSRNDLNLSVDVDGDQNKIVNGSIAFKNLHLSNNIPDTSTHEIMQGEYRAADVATQYLLTSITNPHYVKVGSNPFDGDDRGNWTHFTYRKIPDYYRHRSPYVGLAFNKGSISSHKDDMGSVQMGEKEVKYLQTIETRTHIAYFVTNKCSASTFLGTGSPQPKIASYLNGTGEDRLDGLAASTLADQVANLNGLTGVTGDASRKKLEYLEKIVLVAKDHNGNVDPDAYPVQVVHFAYGYSLCPNLPNNLNGRYPNQPAPTERKKSGKLTLERVWFESGGAHAASVSPYEFSYTYKKANAFAPEVVAKYPWIRTETAFKLSDGVQNPDYAPFLLDAWGQPQPFAAQRQSCQLAGRYQGVMDENSPSPSEALPGDWRKIGQLSAFPNKAESFDPAAWQLKSVKLPTGGEILVQYEEKEYAWVQDRKAMAMASLTEASERGSGLFGIFKNPTYKINVRDLGINPSSTEELDQQVRLMQDYFREEKVYFKFLYNLSDRGSAASLSSCHSEYITGYSEVVNVEKVGTSIRLTLGKLGSTDQDGYHAVPRQACYDYYTTQRLGKWKGTDCTTEPEKLYNPLFTNGSSIVTATASALAFMPFMATVELPQVLTYNIPTHSQVGTDLSLPLSFLKVPMLHNKKGGGCRVKRLLMYDKGLEPGDAVLYGQEYFYEKEQPFKANVLADMGTPPAQGVAEPQRFRTISSGVAVNEPAGLREENPMVKNLPRKSQSWYNRLTVGQNKDQSEGPVGENLLPGAGICYSRVVVQNIHTGTTGSGYTIHEYLTAKEYPVDGIYVPFDPSAKPNDPLMLGGTGTSDLFDFGKAPAKAIDYTDLSSNTFRDKLNLPMGVVNYTANQAWATQGYRFILNSMHGKQWRTADFAGTYASPHDPTDETQEGQRQLVKEQITEYYPPGRKVPFVKPNGTIGWFVPGKEMEVSTETALTSERIFDMGIELDVGAGVAMNLVISAGGLNFSIQNTTMHSHVISKVIRYPAIVRKITTTQDGIRSSVENVLYDELSGQAIATRTQDEYNNYVYTCAVPAHWIYGRGNAAQPWFGQTSLERLLNPVANQDGHKNLVEGQVGSITALYPPNAGSGIDEHLKFQSGAAHYGMRYNFGAGDKIIAANAQTYFMPGGQEAPSQQYSYVWKGDGLATASIGNPWEVGYSTDFISFPYASPPANAPDNPWLRTSTVTHVNLDGLPTEEKDAMDFYTGVRFGYFRRLPVVIGKNARESEIYFNDFEVATTNIGAGHTGKNGLLSSGSVAIATALELTKLADRARTFEILLWAKGNFNPTTLSLTGVSLGTQQLVANTGEWNLYRIPFNISQGSDLVDASTFTIASGNVEIDDLLIRPADASTTCYVYDPASQKLVAQFDDQHFPLLYQYDAQGRLVSKLKETVRGTKLLSEGQYNTPVKPR